MPTEAQRFSLKRLWPLVLLAGGLALFFALGLQRYATLEALRNQGGIDKSIGWDLSTAAIWRPKATQNIVGRLSAAVLLPGDGFKDLFENRERDRAYVSVLANLIVSF